jgi:hypothetical protein
MSRDRRGNGIQEVVGSIPISSTKEIKKLARPKGRAFQFAPLFAPLCDLGVALFVSVVVLTAMRSR